MALWVGRGQRPSRPAVTQAAPGVDVSLITFPAVPSAVGKGLESGIWSCDPWEWVNVRESQCGLLEFELLATPEFTIAPTPSLDFAQSQGSVEPPGSDMAG